MSRRLFTAQEDAQLLALKAAGLKYHQIGQQMMRSTASIGGRIKRLTEGAGNPAAAKARPAPHRPDLLAAQTNPGQPGGRTCLHCGHLFASAHAGNRTCKSCKRRHAELGYAHDPI